MSRTRYIVVCTSATATWKVEARNAIEACTKARRARDEGAHTTRITAVKK